MGMTQHNTVAECVENSDAIIFLLAKATDTSQMHLTCVCTILYMKCVLSAAFSVKYVFTYNYVVDWLLNWLQLIDSIGYLPMVV